MDAMLKSNAREGEILSGHAAMESNRHNLDRATVDDFGREWQRFDQSSVSSGEVRRRFGEYFALFPWDSLPSDAVGFDAGCGSGRWAALVAPRVGRLHCIDASADALSVAQKSLAGLSNVSFHAAPLDAMPLADNSMDFGYSLGVLHHLAARRLPPAQLLCHAHRRARPLRHPHRTSHDASPDQDVDGRCRVARHTLSGGGSILVRRRPQDLARSTQLRGRSGPGFFRPG